MREETFSNQVQQARLAVINVRMKVCEDRLRADAFVQLLEREDTLALRIADNARKRLTEAKKAIIDGVGPLFTPALDQIERIRRRASRRASCMPEGDAGAAPRGEVDARVVYRAALAAIWDAVRKIEKDYHCEVE